MNRQSGLALPLAMVTLAVGALVVAPFLGLAGTSLLGSRVYDGAVSLNAALDAGIEHAVWRLTRSDLAAQFSSPGDQYGYQLPDTVNGFSPEITVTANVTPQGAAGEITGTINSFTYDATRGNHSDILNISGEIYVIAFQGPGSDGFIKTLNISSEGVIGGITDTLEFDTSAASFPAILPVSAGVYAIAYEGPGSDGFIKTVSIAADGSIGDSVIDTLEFDTSSGQEPSFLAISAGVFAVAYRGPGSDGFIKTIGISPEGAIADSVIDTLEFDTGNGQEPDIIHVSGDVYAIVYAGPGGDGFIITVSISSTGDIGSVTDTLEFDTASCELPVITFISGNVYAVTYTGPNNDGFIKTVSLAPDGTIGGVIAAWEFEPDFGLEVSIINIDGDIFALAYRGPGNRGTLLTFTISAGGDIGPAVDTFVFTSECYFPAPLALSEGIFAMAYSGASIRGQLLTLRVVTAAGAAASYEIVSAAGGVAIRALVDVSGTTASIISWEIE